MGEDDEGDPDDEAVLARVEALSWGRSVALGELVGFAGKTLMPRDGSLILSDIRGPTLAVVCEPCGRRGRHNVERLISEHGDAKLTDLLVTLVDCPEARARSASTTDAKPGNARYYGP